MKTVPLTLAQRELCLKLHGEGLTTREIGRRAGCSHNGAHKVIKAAYGLTRAASLRLTPEVADAARALAATGMKRQDIAATLGVAKSSVTRMLGREHRVFSRDEIAQIQRMFISGMDRPNIAACFGTTVPRIRKLTRGLTRCAAPGGVKLSPTYVSCRSC